MLSKFLVQFSVDGQGCVPSLLFDLRPNYGRGNEDNGSLLQKVLGTHCYNQCPQPCSRPLLGALVEVGVEFVPEGSSPGESQRARTSKAIRKG